ncbi:MAG: hypothetical protein A4E52_00217 [Pelotomaculum sp. PtaB.Bin013]|uniref:Methyltransferase domain-containing protein n=1 Tax=Pelotomaculum isophthalicicum JI TaxID=947010 RepID=A0A9X4JV20_9FIRM|nr:class I SAM-dependent methyltransferase [Pelotomaculum isophthalicicum]MDF9407466.1 methyltransferase domain-containing protein [Pelotomaculum isophthalicicum JI]OPX92006.1 MAG: hypothetical protein A4E52_00217 [Pelotomaculum sp. PtaB.Bin013]
MINKDLGSAVHIVQMIIAKVLKSGGTAVDATAGNGNDTLFLAQTVGSEGRVYAFDIQEKALKTTRKLLERHNAARQVTLLNTGHEGLDKSVPVPVDAVVFNLGYLPGGDHALVTRPDTTIGALKSAIGLLRQGGRIGMVIYTGHPGGAEELYAVEQFTSGLEGSEFNVIKISYLNRSAQAPVIIVIEKAGAPHESQAATQNP